VGKKFTPSDFAGARRKSNRETKSHIFFQKRKDVPCQEPYSQNLKEVWSSFTTTPVYVILKLMRINSQNMVKP